MVTDLPVVSGVCQMGKHSLCPVVDAQPEYRCDCSCHAKEATDAGRR